MCEINNTVLHMWKYCHKVYSKFEEFWFKVFFLEYHTSLYFCLKTVFWCIGLCNVQALRTQKLINNIFLRKKVSKTEIRNHKCAMPEGPLVLYVYQFLICGIESASLYHYIQRPNYQNYVNKLGAESFFHVASWLFFFVQKKIKSVSYI